MMSYSLQTKYVYYFILCTALSRFFSTDLGASLALNNTSFPETVSGNDKDISLVLIQ